MGRPLRTALSGSLYSGCFSGAGQLKCRLKQKTTPCCGRQGVVHGQYCQKLTIPADAPVSLLEVYLYVKQPQTDVISVVKQVRGTRLNALPVE